MSKIRVRAVGNNPEKMCGYHDEGNGPRRVYPGEVITIDEAMFSEKWMSKELSSSKRVVAPEEGNIENPTTRRAGRAPRAEVRGSSGDAEVI